jgi:hypothetical protein
VPPGGVGSDLQVGAAPTAAATAPKALTARCAGAIGASLFLHQFSIRRWPSGRKSDSWRSLRRGWQSSLFLTPKGLSAHGAGRFAFASWPSIEDARAFLPALDRAATIRVRFSNPIASEAMRRTRRPRPLIRSGRWHLFWDVFGTGVEGKRLARTIVRCSEDATARPMVGSDHGLVALGLVDASGSSQPDERS